MNSRTSLFGAILASVGAAASGLCCLPIALSTLGAGTALAATLGPLRPYLTGLSVIFWGSAFYSLYLREESCETGCRDTKSLRRQKVLLWISGLILLTLSILTYWGSWVIYWLL